MVITRSVLNKSFSINKITHPLNPVKWEKVLYKHQPFPDNYMDEALFLDKLRTNVDVVKYPLLEAIRGGATLMSQVDLVIIYLVIFEFCRLEFFDTQIILFINITICFVLLTLVILCYEGFCLSGRYHCRTLITIFTFGYTFTPVIRTLTTTISTDSVWASAIILFLISLLVHDYGMESYTIASKALSVNICLSASVFLISRINNDPLAFLLLGLSLQLFCFWPQLRNILLSRSPNVTFLFLLPLAVISMGILALLNKVLAVLHLNLHFLLIGLFPSLLFRMQQWKSTIHGPWDEVTLRAKHLVETKN